MTKHTFYNDVFGAEPHAGEPEAFSSMPQHEAGPAPDGADGTDRTDGTDTNSQPSGPHKERPVSQASQIVTMVLERGAELFHDPNDEPYITVAVDGHRQTLLVERVGKLAGTLFYDAFRRAPGRQAVQEALDVLSGRAVYAGATHPVWTRLAEHDGRLYLDLGDASWHAVE